MNPEYETVVACLAEIKGELDKQRAKNARKAKAKRGRRRRR